MQKQIVGIAASYDDNKILSRNFQHPLQAKGRANKYDADDKGLTVRDDTVDPAQTLRYHNDYRAGVGVGASDMQKLVSRRNHIILLSLFYTQRIV